MDTISPSISGSGVWSRWEFVNFADDFPIDGFGHRDKSDVGLSEKRGNERHGRSATPLPLLYSTHGSFGELPCSIHLLIHLIILL